MAIALNPVSSSIFVISRLFPAEADRIHLLDGAILVELSGGRMVLGTIVHWAQAVRACLAAQAVEEAARVRAPAPSTAQICFSGFYELPAVDQRPSLNYD